MQIEKIVENESFDVVILRYDRLFHKAVRHCGVFSSHPDYEDCLQIARIVFYENLIRLKDSQETIKIGPQFGSIVWRIRDFQRQKQRQEKIAEKAAEKPVSAVCQAECLSWENLWGTLTEAERGYLTARTAGCSQKEIGQNLGLSQPTLRKVKASLKQKFYQAGVLEKIQAN